MFVTRSEQKHGSFKDRYRTALARRLFPYTSLRADVLADAIGKTPMTIRNHLRGDCNPGSDAVSDVIDYFTFIGDPTFFQELYPNACEPLIVKRREAERALELFNNLKELWQGAAA